MLEVKCIAISPSRPHLLAVGANDPFVRLFDRRMLTPKRSPLTGPIHSLLGRRGSMMLGVVPPPSEIVEEDYSLEAGAMRIFCPAHLREKAGFRPLATTYLSFHPSAQQLLVNLGGEHIYTFDLLDRGQPLLMRLPAYLAAAAEKAAARQTTNGTSQNGRNGAVPAKQPRLSSWRLDLVAERQKEAGNSAFSQGQWSKAVFEYSGALLRCPNNPVLLANRAAALMRRGWDGDVYAALRDSYASLEADGGHAKALFRLAKSLCDLGQIQAATSALTLFRLRFPREAVSPAFRNLVSAVSDLGPPPPPPDPPLEPCPDPDNPAGPSEYDLRERRSASDYSSRFLGHCNTTTDIKEASYLGRAGEFVAAGSDDGTFFLWEAGSGRIVSILRGDASIVNCLQPHPSTLLLATSGIDSSIKLWRPRQGEVEGPGWRVGDVERAASDNQRRMNADPFEAMLLQFVAQQPRPPDNLQCAQS